MDASFERNDSKDEYLTPLRIIRALGEFDLDPCSPIMRPWDTAKKHFNKIDDGLKQDWGWRTRVWLNPPYGSETKKWIKKLAEHGNGIALIYARTETKMFFDYVWDKADAIFFFKGRLTFYDVEGRLVCGKDGKPQCAGAPSCLAAYGSSNDTALFLFRLTHPGKYIKL